MRGGGGIIVKIKIKKTRRAPLFVARTPHAQHLFVRQENKRNRRRRRRRRRSVRARWWSLKKILCIYYRRVRFFVLFRVARRWSLARPTAGHGLLLLPSFSSSTQGEFLRRWTGGSFFFFFFFFLTFWGR